MPRGQAAGAVAALTARGGARMPGSAAAGGALAAALCVAAVRKQSPRPEGLPALEHPVPRPLSWGLPTPLACSRLHLRLLPPSSWPQLCGSHHHSSL